MRPIRTTRRRLASWLAATALAAKGVAVTLFDEKRQTELKTANAEHIGDAKWRVKMSAPVRGTWLLSLNVKTASADQVEIAAPIVIE